MYRNRIKVHSKSGFAYELGVWCIVILLSFAVYGVSKFFRITGDLVWLEILTLTYALNQFMFFCIYLLDKIKTAADFNKGYLWYILSVLNVIFLLTLIFAVDYYISYKLRPSGWVLEMKYQTAKPFDFYYYSFMTFTTIGYGELKAVGWLAKFLTMTEIIASVSVFIFILSGLDQMKNEIIVKNKLIIGSRKKVYKPDSTYRKKSS